MIRVLVTGANGQLGQSIQSVSNKYRNLDFLYTDYLELNLTDNNGIKTFFDQNSFDFCINCAAYTSVDLAESEQEKAFLINSDAVKNLAEACKENKVVLIHISTDFVFDGLKTTPYTELDATNPINVYGASKLAGEQHILDTVKKHFIIRTSWLYSEFGNNFFKTMLKLAIDKDELSIISDQIGTPTYAPDLADAICKVIEGGYSKFGIYHYSNKGIASWYDFAKAIFEETDVKIKLNSITTDQYPTPAQRPVFSVLDKNKIKETVNLEIPFWKDSLKTAVLGLKK